MRTTVIFLLSLLPIAAQADGGPTDARAVQYRPPDNIAIFNTELRSILFGGGAALLLLLAFRITLGKDIRLIKDRNERSWSLYKDGLALLKGGDNAGARARFLAARAAFDRPGFHIEQALATMGAGDSAEALGDDAECRTLYGEAERILLDHPVPHQEPASIGVVHISEWQVERSQMYEAALKRCRTKLSAWGPW